MSEQEEISPEVAEAARAYLTALAEGKCPTCGAVVQEEEQVGRCVYARPCGHRLYQGKAPQEPKKLHPYFQEQLDMQGKP